MIKLKSVLNEAQWAFFDALAPAARAQSFVVMPAVRLQHWVKDLTPRMRTAIAQGDGALAWTCRNEILRAFMRSSVLFSLVRVDVDATTLCLAVCDDRLSTLVLEVLGIKVMSWDAVRSLTTPAELVSVASNAYRHGTSHVRKTHAEEQTLLRHLSAALLLDWPTSIDKQAQPPEHRALIEQYIAERNESMTLLHEVAVSRFIGLDESNRVPLSEGEKKMLSTSSVDILVHARFPDRAPVLAVEYDGWHHESDPNKIANDEAKDELFRRTGLALVRIRASEAKAKERWDQYKHRMDPVHPRLPFLLRIVDEIVRKRLTELQRRRELLPFWEAEAKWLVAAGRALFGKDLNQLTREQLQRVFESTTPPGGTGSEMLKMEWTVEDLMDRDDQLSWNWHLQSAGVPEDAVVDDVRVDRSEHGWVATTVVQHGGAKIRLATERITLRAPTLAQDAIEDLVIGELYASLTTQIQSWVGSID